jgi:hypothetical protein
MGQLAEMDELSDRMRQLMARWITARLVSMSVHGATLDCIDHLLEQMHHLHTQNGQEQFHIFLFLLNFISTNRKRVKASVAGGLVKAPENR